jgi:DNA-directed RNA polymerase subunit H (RpoH/RPB5)
MEVDRILTHLAEMLEARGEDISEFVEHADAVPRARYYSERIVLNTPETTLFFVFKKELMKELTREFKDHETPAEFLAAYKSKNIILVATEPPSPAVQNTLQGYDRSFGPLGGSLQLFLKRELLYNPSRHELVPKHTKLTTPEIEALKERYMLKSKLQLPHIHRNDVMAKWLGLRHGDVVRITRYNDTSGEYDYYRYCV